MFDRDTGLPNEILVPIFKFFNRSELSKSLTHVNTRFKEMADNQVQSLTRDYTKQDATLRLMNTKNISHAILTNYGTKLFLVDEASIDIIDLTTNVVTNFSLRSSTAACSISDTEILTGDIKGMLWKWDTQNNTYAMFLDVQVELTNVSENKKVMRSIGSIKKILKWNETEIIIACALLETQNSYLYKLNLSTKDKTFITAGYGNCCTLTRFSSQQLLFTASWATKLINIENNMVDNLAATGICITNKIPNANHYLTYHDCDIYFHKLDNLYKPFRFGIPEKKNNHIKVATIIAKNRIAIGAGNEIFIIEINENDSNPIQVISVNTLFNEHNEYREYREYREDITAIKLLPNKTQLAVCTDANRFLIHDIETKKTNELIKPSYDEYQFKNSRIVNEQIIIMNDENIIFVSHTHCYKISFPLKKELDINAEAGVSVVPTLNLG